MTKYGISSHANCAVVQAARSLVRQGQMAHSGRHGPDALYCRIGAPVQALALSQAHKTLVGMRATAVSHGCGAQAFTRWQNFPFRLRL